MARNVLKCNLTDSVRITNNSYLKKQLDRLGVTEEYFRYHYATRISIQLLREEITNGNLAQCALRVGEPEKEPSNVEWLLRVAIMNGKNKIFTDMLTERGIMPIIKNRVNVTASITTIVKTDVPGEPETSEVSSGNLV